MSSQDHTSSASASHQCQRCPKADQVNETQEDTEFNAEIVELEEYLQQEKPENEVEDNSPQTEPQSVRLSTSEKLQSGFIAILTGLTIVLSILNMFGGLISGIWLAVLGEWGAIYKGIILIIISGFVVSFALMPALLLAAPGIMAIEKGKKMLGVLFGSLNVLYTIALMTTWCLWVMWSFTRFATEGSLIPALVWSYGVALSPWIWLAEGDRRAGLHESMVLTFFAEISYIVSMVMLFFGTSMTVIGIVFAVILLVGDTMQIALALRSKTHSFHPTP